jgi:Fe-S cluster biogenesis protein NfuA
MRTVDEEQIKKALATLGYTVLPTLRKDDGRVYVRAAKGTKRKSILISRNG